MLNISTQLEGLRLYHVDLCCLVFSDVSDRDGRETLEEELSKPIYQERPSLLKKIVEWFADNFSSANVNPVLPSWLWLIAALVVAMLVIIIMILFSGNWKFREQVKPTLTDDAAVFEDNRSAVQYLAAAKNALSRGDYSTAFLEQFRHLLRLCEANELLVITPGLTAGEGSAALSRVIPSESEELAWAAGVFNALRYGRRQSDNTQVQRLIALDSRLDSFVSHSRTRVNPTDSPRDALVQAGGALQ